MQERDTMKNTIEQYLSRADAEIEQLQKKGGSFLDISIPFLFSRLLRMEDEIEILKSHIRRLTKEGKKQIEEKDLMSRNFLNPKS